MAYEWLDKIREYLPANKREGAYEEIATTAGSTQGANGTASAVSQWESWMRVARNGIPVAMLIVGGILALFTELIGVWAIFGYVLVAGAPVVYLLLRIEQRLIEVRDGIQRLSSISAKNVSRSSSFSKYD
jgi:hypothetical protein